ncbi:hypothetical protein J3458_007071 [Metarhizium acridum]|uniref:uncharacterized protein n=1 Tax=Metarhizium acridum TaxID=92637 RepID=UPI001C6AB869|nr:hypothetical protein J3458_007071 [Metarhizium acridum]
MSMSIEVQCDCPHGAGSRRSVTTLGSRPAQTADCSPWANALYPSRPDTVKARLDFIGASSFESVQFSSNFVAAQRGSGESERNWGWAKRMCIFSLSSLLPALKSFQVQARYAPIRMWLT